MFTIFINIFQYHTMCSKQGKPSVPVRLTRIPSSSVGRNSDPFLGLPGALYFSLAQVSTQEIANKKKVLRYNEFGIVRTPWSLKAKVTASDG